MEMETTPYFFMLCVVCLLHMHTATAALPPCDSYLRLYYPEYFTHCDCIYPDWSEWEIVGGSNVTVPLDKCPSGQAFSEIRRQVAIGEGCTDKTETRQICMPDDIDRIIMALGLGSSGHDYGSSELYTSRFKPFSCESCNDHNHTVVLRQTQCESEEVCLDFKETRGKRSIGEERFGKKLSWNSRPLQNSAVLSSSDSDPLPFEWKKHHHRFRRQSGNCGVDSEQYILFLLDTSGSIAQHDFERVKNGISKLIALVCKKVRAAVMTFNHEFKQEFCFDCFDSDCTGRTTAVDAIKAIDYRSGWTHTGGATKCACNVFLSPSCGLPSDASCIDVVYITDGKSNDPTLKVCDEVRCLHSRYGVNTYAIGIGNRVDQAELDCITNFSNSASIFNFTSFADFETKLGKLEQRLINDLFQTGTDTPKYTCIAPVDPDSTAGTQCPLGPGLGR